MRRFHFAVTMVFIVTAVAGCGGSKTPAASAPVNAPGAEGDDEYAVISPEDAQADAERTIDAENADRIFEELSAEIESELEDDG